MQKLKNFNWKNFFLQGVLPFALAITAAFIGAVSAGAVRRRYAGLSGHAVAAVRPAECPDRLLPDTGVICHPGQVEPRHRHLRCTVHRDRTHQLLYPRSARLGPDAPGHPEPGHRPAEVMGSYTLQITATVRTIILWYLPVLAIAFVQGQLVKGLPQARQLARPRCAGTGLCRRCVLRTLFRLLWAGFRSSPKPPTVGPGRIPIISTATWPVPSRPPA